MSRAPARTGFDLNISDVLATILGTPDQVIVTDNGNDTITLSTPQDIATSSTPTFAGMILDPITFAAMIAISSPVSGQLVYVGDNTVEDIFTFDPIINGGSGQWKAPQYKIFNNDSGGALVAGDVVIISTTTDNSIDTTAIAIDNKVVGVIAVGGADSTDVLVKSVGEILANKTAVAATTGQFFSPSGTVKLGLPANDTAEGSFAKVIEDAAIGAAQVRIYMHPMQQVF